MSAKFLPSSWLFAAALMALATDSLAEAQGRSVAPVNISPKMIEQVSAPAQLTRDSPYLLRGVDPQHDIFRDAPRNLEHIPNGCAKNDGSLCFDYRAAMRYTSRCANCCLRLRV